MKYPIRRDRKQIRDYEGQKECDCLMHEVYVGGNEKVLELDNDNGCKTL